MQDWISNLFIDSSKLPHTYYGFVQIVFLGFVYGVILFHGSKMLSDGSELLFLIPSLSGIVGSIILPIFGAIPDGILILFSCMGKDAQERILVGVGNYVGSTVMLSTIPWALSIWAGRVPFYNGHLFYSKAGKQQMPASPTSRKCHFFTGSGVAVSSYVGDCALQCIFCMVGLLLMLIMCGTSRVVYWNSTIPRIAPLVISIKCFLNFFWYLYKLKNLANSGENKPANAQEIRAWIQALEVKQFKLSELLNELADIYASSSGTQLAGDAKIAPQNPILKKKVHDLLRPFYHHLDQNKDGTLSQVEIRILLAQLNEAHGEMDCFSIFRKFDKDGSGHIDFDEFCDYMIYTMCNRNTESFYAKESYSDIYALETQLSINANEDCYDDEDMSVADDYQHLSLKQRRQKIFVKSFSMMFMGLAIVLLFSDPMVDVVCNIASRLSIPAFCVSFVITPFITNASEVIAAVAYARKKTRKTIEVSFSALLGACSMNTTFVFGILCLIIFMKGFTINFDIEVSILVPLLLIISFLSQRKILFLWHSVFFLLFYPLSLLAIYVLKKIVP